MAMFSRKSRKTMIILIVIANVVSGADILNENELKIRAALRVGSYAFAGDLIRIGGDGDGDGNGEPEDYDDYLNIYLNAMVVVKRSQDGNTPLHLAVLNKNDRRTRRLVRVYSLADLNAKNKLGFTALHAACAIGNEFGALALIRRNVEIDTEAFDGSTPFSIAVDASVDATNRKPKERIAALLLKQGANIRPKIWNDCNTRNFLHRAIMNDCYHLAKHVVQKGALTKEEMNAKCNGCPPLCMAIKYNMAELATALTHAGVDMTAADDKKSTVLHYAVRSNNGALLRLVLRHNVDLEGIDGTYTSTPSRIAARCKFSPSAVILMEFGAEISPNVDVQVIMQNLYPYLAEITRENGADFDTFDDYIATATEAHTNALFSRDAFPKRLSRLVRKYEMSQTYALCRLLKSQYAGKFSESSVVEKKKFEMLNQVLLNLVEKTYMERVPVEIIRDVFFIAGHYARKADRLSHLLALASHKLNIEMDNWEMQKMKSEKLKEFT